MLDGYPYIGTDVAQAFYLYQNHMLSNVATNLVELVVEDGDILSLETPKPGTAVHIPWWKWVTLTPNKVKLSAGIMTSNHCLCEMHPNSMAYLAMLSSGILGRHQGGGTFVFDSWGYDLLHGEDAVLVKFMEHGFRLCHNEVAVSAMALAEHTRGWPVYGTASTGGLNFSIEKARLREKINRMPQIKKPLVAMVNRIPGLRRAILALFNSPAGTQSSRSSRIADVRLANPLSRRLTAGRDTIFKKAEIGMPEIKSFLTSHFNGSIPELPDETFLNLIGTRQ